MQGKQDLHGSDCTGPRIPGSDCTLWNRLCSARLSIAFKVKSYHTELARPFVTTPSVYEAEYRLYCLPGPPVRGATSRSAPDGTGDPSQALLGHGLGLGSNSPWQQGPRDRPARGESHEAHSLPMGEINVASALSWCYKMCWASWYSRAVSLEGERCWATRVPVPRVRNRAGDNNGIYFFVRELGGSQAFQGLALEFFDFSAANRDCWCCWAQGRRRGQTTPRLLSTPRQRQPYGRSPSVCNPTMSHCSRPTTGLTRPPLAPSGWRMLKPVSTW